jgi:predicted aspartyl protease
LRGLQRLVVSSFFYVSAPQVRSNPIGLPMRMFAGTFDASNTPTLEIRVNGDDESKVYRAAIDTGFTGFVSLPINEMIPLRLKTDGAAKVTLADGSEVIDLLAPGSVTLGDQTEAGLICLNETSAEVLIGIEFLRTFKLALIVTSTRITLYDEKETLQPVADFMEYAPLGEPNVSSGGDNG